MAGKIPAPAAPAALAAALGLIAAAVFLTGCASQAPPGGGPKDTTPPSIASTDPPAGALDVREGRIRIEFSEYVDRRSLQESAYLSPFAGQLTYDWSGTSVDIAAAETLRANTTYILTIGTDLKDSRNNPMDQSFTLPFSTGGVIDSCSISGRVDDQSPGGVMIYAFDLSGGRGDTLNPAAVKPDYLTQSGKDGTFLLRNMREGAYRVMAVRDAFKNLLYNVGTDQYGMASSDLRVGGDSRAIDGLGFRLTSEDTLRPFLSGARAKNGASILLHFNEAVFLPGGISSVAITDTARGVRLDAFELSPIDSTNRDFIVTTAPQAPGAVYRVVAASFTDEKGNAADSAARSAIFAAGEGRDSLPPVLASNIAHDSLTGFPPDDTVSVTFNRPVDTAAFSGGFALLRGGARQAGMLRWSGPMSARFIPAQPFEPGAWYSIGARHDSIRDRGGLHGHDSLLQRRFRITEEKMLASIGGRVKTAEAAGARGEPLIVEARNLTGAGAGEIRVRADSSGAFRLERLAAGRYVLSAFLDRNGNGVHDCGLPFPVTFAEPFGLYPDTIKVRSGWPVDGVLITIGR